MSTNTVLRGLTPDTEYRVSVVPVYADVEGKRVSENGKTSRSHAGGVPSDSGSINVPGVHPRCPQAGPVRSQTFRVWGVVGGVVGGGVGGVVVL